MLDGQAQDNKFSNAAIVLLLHFWHDEDAANHIVEIRTDSRDRDGPHHRPTSPLAEHAAAAGVLQGHTALVHDPAMRSGMLV